MDVYCTRPGCPKAVNPFADLDDPAKLKTVQQKYCTTCGMPLFLIGRYLPLKLLGQGGFGAAFLAIDRYTPGLRQCVVKQFLPSVTLSPTQLQTAQELFEREAQALDVLGNAHPQIPDLFAFFELTVPAWQSSQDRFFYLVQEFIDGQTMEEELEQNGVFSSQAVLEVLQEVLQVLQFVHENGSIHRDIKPSNIMRHRNGAIYLLDFGAVRQATKSSVKSTGIYSEGFAPPEQMSGGEVYPSSDLYALAVTCVLLLTGKQPSELLDTYSNTWRWRTHAPNVSPNLASVLDRMLQATPKERFQSVAEVLQALSVRPSGLLNRRTTQSAQQSSPPSRLAAPHAANPTPSSPAPAAIAQSQSSQPAPAAQPATIAPFSTLELLAGAGFTGFEAGLLAIAVVSLLGTTFISAGFWLILVVGLVLAQSRRFIERRDLWILGGLSFALVFFFAPVQRVIMLIAGSKLITLLVIAGIAALVAILLTALFRLIYKVLSGMI